MTTRWLWESRAPGARAVRALLLPLAGLYHVVMLVRAAAYRRHWPAVRSLSLPTVAVGNLTVGGAGKTPIASWIADWLLRRGARPAILLRGYGGDEPLVHARLVPKAIIQANPDRVRGAALARDAGADVLVLDDAYQTLSVSRSLNLALVAVEQLRYSPWPLPAGPWREGWGALSRADGIIVTRKRESAAAAVSLSERLERQWPGRPIGIVHLALTGLEGLKSGRPAPDGALQGRRVLAAAGVADPDSFAAQLRERSGTVQLVAYQDHHAYSDADVAALLNAATTTDYVVVTEKDAVKLRPRWPAEAREPLVATLGVRWERGQQAFETLLSTLTEPSTPVI
jgi:tetraacyldisaccharide 4'-kinase